jgi:hypothetical protein
VVADGEGIKVEQVERLGDLGRTIEAEEERALELVSGVEEQLRWTTSAEESDTAMGCAGARGGRSHHRHVAVARPDSSDLIDDSGVAAEARLASVLGAVGSGGRVLIEVRAAKVPAATVSPRVG